MFSKNISLASYLLFETFSRLGFCPIKVDQKVGKFYVHFWSRVRATHSWIWLVAYTFLVLPTHLVELYKTQKLHQFNYTLLLMLFSTMGIILVGDALWQADGICRFLNGLFKYLEDFPGKSNETISYSFSLHISFRFCDVALILISIQTST